MKILYDHQVFSFQNYGGISRYFYELIRRLSDLEVDYDLAIKLTNNHYLQQLDLDFIKPFFKSINFRGKNRIIYELNQLYAKQKLKNQDYDLAHPTYYDPYLLPYLKNKPFCLTVHDMIHERFPEQFSKNDKTLGYKKKMIEKSSGIIAISEHTKRDLLEYFSIDESMVRVIHHGHIDLKAMACPAVEFNAEKLPKKYLLYVGARLDLYKNFNFFIQSITPLLKQYPDWSVLCVGGGGFTKQEKEFFASLQCEQKISQVSVADHELYYYYSRAAAFVFPSFYEGFGFPILEAFSSGCPVYLSRASCFPEIAGEAAFYFDPFDQEDLRAVLLPIFQEEGRVRSKIDLAYEQLKFFSWNESVRETTHLYEQLVG